MAYSVFRVPNSITVLPTTGNQIVATIQGASGQSADLQQWQDYLGNIISRIDSAGNHSGVAGTFSGNVAINGGSLTTSQTTANLFNTTATTLNIGQASTTTNLGAANGTVNIGGTTAVNILTATGTINANGGTIATNQTTFNLANTTATTVNAFGASTQTNIGNGAGFIILQGTTTGNVITATGTINANGGTIATNQTTANLFTANATTINIGSASSTGVFAGNIAVNGGTISTTASAGYLYNTNATNVYIGGAAGGSIVLGGGSNPNIWLSGAVKTIGSLDGSSASYTLLSTPTTITMGGSATTTTIGSAGGTINLNGTVSINGLSTTGNIQANNITATGTLNANGGTIATTQTTANLFNTTATTVNIGGAGTTNVNNLTATGTINANNGTIATNQTTANLLNTTATTVNAFGAATTTNIGAAGGTVNIGGTTAVNILTATGTINANGGTIATNQTTANLLNTNATTVNAFGAATTTNISTGSTASGVVNINTNSATGTINIGSATSNTYIAGNLYVAGQTVTVNSTQISTSDLFLNLGSGVGAVGAPLTGAGLILGSGTAGNGLGVKFTYNYNAGTPYWSSTENMSLATGKTYMINGTTVLSSTTLGSAVNISSLQQVGTIATGVWNGTVIGTGYTTAQVTAVTAGATNTISVTGTLQAPYINLATVSQGSTGTSFVKVGIDGYGRVINNTAVASGDIPNLSAAQITAGTLAVAQGGTNLSSYTVGDLLYASATTTISKLAAVASGSFLVSNGTSTAPFYRTLTTPDITGALGYTPASSASGVTGSGSSGTLAVWNTGGNITYDNDLKYDTTNNLLTLAYTTVTSSGDVTVGASVTTIDQFPTGTYRSGKYLVQTKNAATLTPTISQISEILVIHDGFGTAFVTEYGQIYTSGTQSLLNLSATISGGNVLVQGTSNTGGSVYTRFTRTSMSV